MTIEETLKGLRALRRDFSGYKPNEEMFDVAINILKQINECDAKSATKCYTCINEIKRACR